VKGYYESVLAELVAEKNLTFAPVFFDADRWYEIDTLEDLSAAEEMFPEPSSIQVDMDERLSPLRASLGIRSRNVVNMKKYSNRGEPMRLSSPLVASD
jgi:hypothetical protein